ncbi:YhaN family protein [uncultured Thiocystis sp.]|uniref:YhaN family protein n=1 Tax=uncultured Thiocystis sp. TaxID=1202134 RepID=UPI0025E2BFED|nr:YhaN family protein [uncultured Thiocystis sp.]
MKILDLHLRAFGPFTDRHLDLSGGQHGLHLIFGPNEAGKSSALRALKALLFGIPERTQDDFLHPRQNLLVGGRFRGPDGNELLCFRRKKRKNSLLNGEDKPIADDSLARLLGGVDERLFERLCGIDHESLVSGGQALLAERGREAEALFGSGLGSVDLHAILKRLDQEAGDLFVPRGSKPSINAGLTRLTVIEREQRAAQLSARDWDETRKAVDQARHRLFELDDELAQATRLRNRLERIRRTLPDLARRDRLLEQLASLGETPNLSEDFARRREDAIAKRALAVASQSGARARCDDLQGKAATLAVSEDLLAEAAVIDDLRARLGSHRKAAQDRPALVIKRGTGEGRAAALLAQIRPGLTLSEAPGLTHLLNRRRRVTELGGSREARAVAVEQARTKLAEIARTLAGKCAALAERSASPSLEGLRRAIEEARRAGDLDRSMAETLARIQRHDEECGRDLAALGLWKTDLAALRRAPLPSVETSERFVAEFQGLDEARRTLEKTRTEAQAERQRIEESLRVFQLAGAVPSEGDLDQARARRDQDWRFIRRQWLEGAEMSAELKSQGAGATQADTFETAVSTADEVADRLRRETKRVHERATAQARLETCEQGLAETERVLVSLNETRTVLQESWRAAWSPSGLEPLPPREMLHWLAKASRLRERAGQGDQLRADLTDARKAREMHAESLTAALTRLGLAVTVAVPDPGLSLRLNQAETHLDALMETQRQRALLEKTIAELQESQMRLELEVKAREDEQATWSTAWAALMDELGLPSDASPGDASDYLKTLDDSLKQIQDAEEFRARIEGIDADAAEFQRRAGALLARLAPDLLERPIEEGVNQLNERLVRQREDRSRLDELQRQLRGAEEEIRRAEADIQVATALLAELCREAVCETPEQLVAVEQRAQSQRQLRRQLAEVESGLMTAGDGLGIDALREEAGRIDRDAVLADLKAIEARIENELRPRQASLLEAKLDAERQFTAMAGDDRAAALAEEAQQTLSSLRAQAEQYVRVKLASRILRDEIERFRRQHRDPILTRASGYFAQLTCHAFTAVETDFDEPDQPVLVGQRATGGWLRVEGMSTGTRDQFYLALRLANLDHHLNDADPLPFIVDDILIQFDDARAQATLGALMDFSARTQVILFTHHQRVVEQAQDLDPTGARVLVHDLR